MAVDEPLAAEVARLRAENARLRRLLELTPEQVRPPAAAQTGLFLDRRSWPIRGWSGCARRWPGTDGRRIRAPTMRVRCGAGICAMQPRVARGIDPADVVAGARAFRCAVAPVYLRRNQVDVLTELPDKIETEVWVQLSDPDAMAYESAGSRRNLMAMRQAAFASHESAKLERLREIVEEAVQEGMKVAVRSLRPPKRRKGRRSPRR